MDNWEKINAVQRMKDYIEEHITKQITLHMLLNCVIKGGRLCPPALNAHE